jgi:hypothetical protein
MTATPKFRPFPRRWMISIIAGAVISLAAAVAPSPATAVSPTTGAELTIDLNDGLTFAHCKFEVRSVDVDAGTAEVMFTTSFRPTGPYNYGRNASVRLECLLSDKSAGAVRYTSVGSSPLYGATPFGYAPALSEVWTIPLRDDYEICANLLTRTQQGSPEYSHTAEACAS